MKFCYYLASIGNPNLDTKLTILIDNLNYIYNDINNSFDIIVNCYETDKNIINCIKNQINNLNFINNMYFYSKKGVLSELFLTNHFNDKINNYDYLFFILDDVKIININIKDMIRIKNKLNISIFSPKIIKATHPWMYAYDNITINNFVEIYLLLLTPSDFNKYLKINTIENKWLWGIDLLFGYYNIKAGIINNYIAEHAIPSIYTTEEQKQEPINLMVEYFKINTPFNNMNEILQIYKPAIYSLNINNL